MKFDQLLSYLNDLTKSEFFTNILYIEYIKNQNNDFSPSFKQKFESIKNLKSCLDMFNLTSKKLKVLEQEFFDYKNNLANIIKENNLK